LGARKRFFEDEPLGYLYEALNRQGKMLL